jgi:predicted nucleic acid-binding protein
MKTAEERNEAVEVDEGQEAVEEMMRAASKALKENSEDIATCLVNNAKKGHVGSVQALREMASAPKKSASKKRQNRPKELASEPEWPGNNNEEAVVEGTA